ncbi:MAG: lysylphosphatidylglycerol synthase domain-containing protein, partial [Candidatus Humimicrobiaceae bacterium]
MLLAFLIDFFADSVSLDLLSFFLPLNKPRISFRIFSKIRPKLGEFHDRLISYRYKIKYLLAALFFSLLLQTFFITSYFFVNLSLGLKMKYQMLLFTQPFTALASGVPIAIGGMGIRENALAFAEETYVDVNIFSDANKDRLNQLNRLPLCCDESADLLS